MASTSNEQVIRFSVFEYDVRAGVLRKRGARLPVQGLPLQVLTVLLEKPGEVVTREEIRSRLWPADTFVDFDHSLHNAIARLRDALDDSASTPRFVETLPRRGYRFIGMIDASTGTEGATSRTAVDTAAPALPVTDPKDAARVAFQDTDTTAERRSHWGWIAAVLAVIATGLAGLWTGKRIEGNTQPALHQITYRRGTVWNARFTPDGNSVVYGAAWDGNPVEIYEGRLDSIEGRPLGLKSADVLAISNSGEMAVLLERRRGPSGFGFNGMLARVPLTGGIPRPVMEKVEGADWGPDGTLAVVYHSGGKARLEYPIGTLRYESATWLSDVRISPNGDRVAFIEHDEPIGDSGMIRVADAKTTHALTRDYGSAQGLAWAPSGKEIWFTAADSGGSARCLRAVDLEGHERVLYRVPGTLKIQDIAKDGRVLFVHELIRAGILAHVPGEEEERELGWLDWSIHRSLSRDGKWLVFDESGDAPGHDSWVFLRRTDGSPAEKLGSGTYGDLSPDGKWVAAVPSDFHGEIILLPVGAGPSHTFPFPALRAYGVAWFPDGKHIALSASESGKGTRIYMVDADTGASRPITPEGSTTRISAAISPDGHNVVARGADGSRYLFPVNGGEPRKLSGLQDGELIFGWTSDAKAIYVGAINETATSIFKIDLVSGHRQWVRTVAPRDKAGLTYLSPLTFTPDGRYYAYSYNRQISELFVGEHIR